MFQAPREASLHPFFSGFELLDFSETCWRFTSFIWQRFHVQFLYSIYLRSASELFDQSLKRDPNMSCHSLLTNSSSVIVSERWFKRLQFLIECGQSRLYCPFCCTKQPKTRIWCLQKPATTLHNSPVRIFCICTFVRHNFVQILHDNIMEKESRYYDNIHKKADIICFLVAWLLWQLTSSPVPTDLIVGAFDWLLKDYKTSDG